MRFTAPFEFDPSQQSVTNKFQNPDSNHFVHYDQKWKYVTQVDAFTNLCKTTIK